MLRNDAAATIALDGVWDFALGLDAPWASINVPGCWEAQGYAKERDGPARYRREVEVPTSWADQRIVLEFNAVSYNCDVRVNNVFVGTHKGMWTPFAFDITNVVRFGERHEIALEV